jgi:beta-lactamase class A
MSDTSELLKIKKKNRTYLIVAVVSTVTTVIFAGLFFYSQRLGVILDLKNPYPLIDPARNFVPQENFAVNLQPLREELRKKASDFASGGKVSIYVEFLNSGANIHVNPTTYVWPASLPKLALSMAVMKKIERGEWKLSNELILTRGDQEEGSASDVDALWKHPIGTRFTIEKLLEELLKNSDNTAHGILSRNMHADEIQVILDDLGMSELFNEEGQVNAKEYSRLFRALYTASFLTREHSQLLLTWLDSSLFNDFLAGAVPEEIPFPHKYGLNTERRAYADSGIVYIPRGPYMITVILEGDQRLLYEIDEVRAKAFMQDISTSVYEYLSKN